MKISECCKAEIITRQGMEYPDGPIGHRTAEEVCSACGEPAIELIPTCGECENSKLDVKLFQRLAFGDCICRVSKVTMNPQYKAGECKYFQWREEQLTLGEES